MESLFQFNVKSFEKHIQKIQPKTFVQEKYFVSGAACMDACTVLFEKVSLNLKNVCKNAI